MGKICVEVCLISGRGLRRTSSLFKLHWYAVGWIDPDNKYCTGIDARGNTNPVWKTKFSAVVDESKSSSEDLALQVEVYSRDPVFLRERLQGTATVFLKEFLGKYGNNSEIYKPFEEVGSFQLRKRNSNKPRGFVDVSIRISEDKEDANLYTGDNGGIKLMDYNIGINLAADHHGPSQANQPQYPLPPFHQSENFPSPTNPSYPQHAVPPRATYPYLSQGGPGYPSASRPAYPPPQTPQLPQPPCNVGYIPSFLPRTENVPPSHLNMPPARAGCGGGAGFGVGLGGGALAAGTVIFGDDFMSGFSAPSGSGDASLTIATNPPF